MTWIDFIERKGRNEIASYIKVTYETIRTWCNREKSPRGKNLRDLCAYMHTQLTPDEYEDFRASLVADLLGEREANSPPTDRWRRERERNHGKPE